MNSLSEFIQVADSWGRRDYVEWLDTGLLELAEPSDDGLPFHPLFLLPTLEPLGQLHQMIKRMPGRIRGAIYPALRDLLSSLTPERPARYCDLAWRLAAGLRPPGGLTEQARHLLAFPSVDIQEPAWLECVRSVLRAVFGYAKTQEIAEFVDDFRVSRHWQYEFAWTYGQYLVQRNPRQWLQFIKDFENDLSNDRQTTPIGYRRRLRTLANAVGADCLAEQFLAMQMSGAPRFLLRDLTGEPEPIVIVKNLGTLLEIQVGETIAECPPYMQYDEIGKVSEETIQLITTRFRSNDEASQLMSDFADRMSDKLAAAQRDQEARTWH